MNPAEQPLTERQLFDQAMSLPQGTDVPAWLEDACPRDAALRARVAGLVQSSSRVSHFLSDEPHGWPTEIVEAREESPGTLLGRYRLEKIIGQGGFGVVWRAQQEEPVRRAVAVKILKPGMDTGAVMARFAAERQTLAMMDHPNVAHVYDAGATSEGRPYFVMEYLEGEPLMAYAGARRLAVQDRLELMQQAAAAVQHAHQKGIIHRDLKPSNIIVVEVDGRAVAKIIDFGIAKMVSPSPEAEVTLAGQQWGTPAYMSPEQLAGGPLDTRTDVYSLGVILYELLTGCTLKAAAQITGGEEPSPPSAVLRRMSQGHGGQARADITSGPLPRELDWIVMKAAAAEPALRYDSAGALRDDLQRFLAGEAVSAGPPGAWYRAQKFIRRHKAIFAAAAAAVLALIAGTIVSLNYARRANLATGAMSDALYEARLTEARAVRQSGVPGQRLRALAAVEDAARRRTTPELRDEALAAMALPDVSPVASLDVIPEATPVFDYDFASDLLVVGSQGSIPILRYRLATGESLGPVPVPLRLAGSLKFCLSPGGGILAVYPIQLIRGVPWQRALTFYETATGRKLCAVPGADFDCESCAFLDGGARAVIPMLAGALSVVNVETGMEERRMETGGRIHFLRASADGSRLLAATLNERKLLLLDAASGRTQHTFTTPAPRVVAGFSPDGRLAAYGDESGGVVTLDAAGHETGGAALASLTGHRGAISSVDFVLGGQFVVTGGWDNTMRLWSPGGGQVMIMEGGRGMAAPGGGRLLVWQGKRVQLLDLVPAAECAAIPRNRAAGAVQTAFSPDGKLVTTRVGTGTLVSTWPGVRPVACVDGRHSAFVTGARGLEMITTDRDGVRSRDMAALPGNGPLRSLTADRSTLLLPGHWAQMAVSGDGRWLAAAAADPASAEVCRIGVVSLTTRRTATFLPWSGAGVGTLVFDPAGQWFAASWWRGRGFTVWDTMDWKPLATRETEVGSLVLAGSAGGGHFGSCSSSELCLWDSGAWQPARRVPFAPSSGSPRQIAFSPDGDLLALESDGYRIRLLRPDTGETVAHLTLPLRERIFHLLFSPDGHTLAAATESHTWLFDLPALRARLRAMGLDFGG